jgi:hypothetical protein
MQRIRALPIVCVAIAGLACSCRKELTAESIEKSPDAIAERGPTGTSTWIVRPDGKVSATLRDSDGKPVTRPVTGQIAFAGPNGPTTSVPVQYDNKSGVLTAAGPALDADITPVSYSLSVGGTPWSGSIEVPKSGTQELIASGRVQASLAPNALGPNGGVVQTVGTDRIELVANKRTGDIRAYVLDADNRPVDPGDRKITVAIQSERPEILVLTPEPQAHFFVGHLHTRVDPPHVTVAVSARGTTHACLVGWSPGTVVLVGPETPRVHLLAVDVWPGEVIEVRGHGRHHGEVAVTSPGVVVGAPAVVVESPSLVVEPPSIVVGSPAVVVGAGVEVHGPDDDRGRRHEHGHEH